MVLTEEEYGFEVPEAVKEKIQQSQHRDSLIDESKLADLEYVDTPKMGYRFVKRAADILLSACGLLILLIPMLIIAVMIYIDDPGEVLFRQYRVGRGGKRFKLYKFRTMKKETPKYLSTMEVEDPQRYLTRLGGFLRKASLDELPQLFNVLKGDMSLIGPRPLIADEYEIHRMRMKLGVYNIRPGVTGLAQINGRDTVMPTEKVRWDVTYARNFGIRMDAKILIGTLPKIFGGEGVIDGYKDQGECENAQTVAAEDVSICK